MKSIDVKRNKSEENDLIICMADAQLNNNKNLRRNSIQKKQINSNYFYTNILFCLRPWTDGYCKLFTG